ncbi:MAG TPA: DNA oxidative demethylase AlkB [Dongiaceae bacterium]|nr:DNA oxidative demethylase AlkB [Dongiaceae bacterium]
MSEDLFANLPSPSVAEPIAEGATILRGFAGAMAPALIEAIGDVAKQAPFRQMTTPGGYQMSVAMTSCGAFGWVTDRQGYRYATHDPHSGAPWPDMPAPFLALATSAAAAGGFAGFAPNSCLINRYEPGSKLSLHQDRDEQDLGAPIVSVSLGMPAIFQFGGIKRSDPIRRHRLESGDVVVWGGATRLAYHGIALLKPGYHPLTGPYRYNLTFRKAG